MCFFSLQGEKSGPEVTLLDLAIVHTSEYFPVSWEASPKRFLFTFCLRLFDTKMIPLSEVDGFTIL